jgi:hypothetical protein
MGLKGFISSNKTVCLAPYPYNYLKYYLYTKDCIVCRVDSVGDRYHRVH